MAIWKRAGSALCGAVAVAAIVGLSAANAMAMPTTTLKAKVTGGGSIKATSTKTELSDNGVSVKCKKSTASGSIRNGTHSGKAPLKVGSATKLSFTSCSGPLGPVHTTVESKPYAISVLSKTKSGKTDGIIGPVKVKVSMTDCSFTVTGFSPGYYDNANHELVVTPVKGVKQDLTVSGVKSGTCGGLVNNGDHPTYKSTYKVNKKVKITVS
jgi:hypothetical protein